MGKKCFVFIQSAVIGGFAGIGIMTVFPHLFIGMAIVVLVAICVIISGHWLANMIDS